MGIWIALAALGLLNVGLVLTVIWLVLCAKEAKLSMKHIDYSFNLAFYNDYIASLSMQEMVSTEEEWKVIQMQGDLQAQASSLGIEAPQFPRPTDRSDMITDDDGDCS